MTAASITATLSPSSRAAPPARWFASASAASGFIGRCARPPVRPRSRSCVRWRRPCRGQSRRPQKVASCCYRRPHPVTANIAISPSAAVILRQRRVLRLGGGKTIDRRAPMAIGAPAAAADVGRRDRIRVRGKAVFVGRRRQFRPSWLQPRPHRSDRGRKRALRPLRPGAAVS